MLLACDGLCQTWKWTDLGWDLEEHYSAKRQGKEAAWTLNTAVWALKCSSLKINFIISCQLWGGSGMLRTKPKRDNLPIFELLEHFWNLSCSEVLPTVGIASAALILYFLYFKLLAKSKNGYSRKCISFGGWLWEMHWLPFSIYTEAGDCIP